MDIIATISMDNLFDALYLVYPSTRINKFKAPSRRYYEGYLNMWLGRKHDRIASNSWNQYLPIFYILNPVPAHLLDFCKIWYGRSIVI